MRLKDKVAIVTGGGVGIGRAISLAFAAEGAAVVVAARTLPRLEAVAEQIRSAGGRATAIQTDVSDENQIKKMVAQTLDEYHQIDILVNNSGIAGPTIDVVDIKLDDWNEVLAIDLTGAMLCAREVLRGMIARRSGNIINISSQAGRGGFARRSPYCVAKWGIIGLTQTLAVETGEYNIRVNGIAPGPVEGERIENVLKAEAEATGLTYQAVRNRSTAKAALRRMVTVTEIADIALFLVSEQSSGITGETFDVNAGSRIRV
jgi:NAD(P)-dependent dehydrogenase (short-subunit alcohol dehydrogenase family)